MKASKKNAKVQSAIHGKENKLFSLTPTVKVTKRGCKLEKLTYDEIVIELRDKRMALGSIESQMGELLKKKEKVRKEMKALEAEMLKKDAARTELVNENRSVEDVISLLFTPSPSSQVPPEVNLCIFSLNSTFAPKFSIAFSLNSENTTQC